MIAADPEAPKLINEPMKYSGSLDHLEYVDVTPIIGREYTKAMIKDILYAPNAEQQLRDLAIVISERGVVFFRQNQLDLSVDELKKFTDQVAKLSGRPKDHGLHVHPIYRDPGNLKLPDGTTDENMYVLFISLSFYTIELIAYPVMLSIPRLQRRYIRQWRAGLPQNPEISRENGTVIVSKILLMKLWIEEADCGLKL